MARYEKTRTYIVKELGKGLALLSAPKGRAYPSLVHAVRAFPARVAKVMKVGKKVTLHRFSNQYTTYFAPKG